MRHIYERLLDHFWLAAAMGWFGVGGATATAIRDDAAGWYWVAVVGLVGAVACMFLDAIRRGRLETRVILILNGVLLIALAPLYTDWVEWPWRFVVVATVLPMVYALVLGLGTLSRRPSRGKPRGW
jgi:hypothetical protein